jgi:hypothetical protein
MARLIGGEVHRRVGDDEADQTRADAIVTPDAESIGGKDRRNWSRRRRRYQVLLVHVSEQFDDVNELDFTPRAIHRTTFPSGALGVRSHGSSLSFLAPVPQLSQVEPWRPRPDRCR